MITRKAQHPEIFYKNGGGQGGVEDKQDIFEIQIFILYNQSQQMQQQFVFEDYLSFQNQIFSLYFLQERYKSMIAKFYSYGIYDIRIMSVNTQTFHQLQAHYQNLQLQIHNDIHHFRNYLIEMQMSLMSKFTNCTQTQEYQMHSSSLKEIDLGEQLSKMKVRNEQLMNELVLFKNKYDELKVVNDGLQKQNSMKQQKVKQLVAEVQQIKLYMKQLQMINKSDNIVNFDDEDDQLVEKRENGLETIKEVSQYDFSITMSMKSFNSELQEQAFSIENSRILSIKSQQDCIQNNKEIQNYEIQNYQDALEILKNYNNGLGSVMTKKDKNSLFDSQAKENIPTLVLNSNVQMQNGEKKVRNGTMAKIKRMKKIENLDIESGYSVKSEKKPFGVIQLNEAVSEESISKQDSRLSIQSQQRKKDLINGESVSSTRIKSRITQEVISLQSQIKQLNQTLAQINLQLQKAKTVSTKDIISVISYQGGYQYRGNCDNQARPHGFGKLMHKNQIIYQGEWRGGKLHGWGKLVLLPFSKKNTKNIVSVDGNFRLGVIQGTVVCIFNTGQKFMGVIRNGNIQEQGTFVSEKGILTGHWQSNNLVFLI